MNWIFLVLLLKVIYAEHETLSVWVDRSESTSGYMCLFLTRILCICRCPVWGAAGGVWGMLCEAWWDPETPLQPLIHLQWSQDHWLCQDPGEGLEYIGTINPGGESTNYAESLKGRFIISWKNPQISTDCTWTAWEMKTQPCIALQKTQQEDFSKSPDINLTAGMIRTCRGHRGPAGVLSSTEFRVSLWAGAEGVWKLIFCQDLPVNLGILWFNNLCFPTKPLFKFFIVVLCGTYKRSARLEDKTQFKNL
jgi:hypothetical protein